MLIEVIERIYVNAAELSSDISDFLRLTVIYLCLLFHSGMLYFLIIKKWHTHVPQVTEKYKKKKVK